MSDFPYLRNPHWIERLLYGPNCRYREGRIGYNKVFYFTHPYELRTVHNFSGHVALTSVLQRVDNNAFNAAKMLEEENQRMVIEVFCRDIAGPVLRNCVLLHGVEQSCELGKLLPSATALTPKTWLWRREDGTEKSPVCTDYGYIKTVLAINAKATERDWKMNGCTVYLSALEPCATDKDISRNFAMLKPDDIQRLYNSGYCIDTVEMTAVVAMKWRSDARERLRQSHRNDSGEKRDLKFKTFGTGQDQEISWTKTGRARGNNSWEVLGFREEGGFSHDQYSEEISRSRVRVLHSSQDEGQKPDHLELGTTYYYTLFLKNPVLESKGDWFRFSVRVPTKQEQDEQLQEITEMRAIVERFRQRPSAEPDEPKKMSHEERLAAGMGQAESLLDAFDSALNGAATKLRKQGVDEEEIDARISKLKATFGVKVEEMLDSIGKAE